MLSRIFEAEKKRKEPKNNNNNNNKKKTTEQNKNKLTKSFGIKCGWNF